MRLLHSSEDLNEWFDMRPLAEPVGSKTHRSLKQNDRYSITYKLFRRRIIQRNRIGAPVASTPLPTRGQQNKSFVLDTVRQRLLIDSPPRHLHPDPDTDHLVTCESEARGTAQSGVMYQLKTAVTPPCATTSRRPPQKQNESMMLWRTAGEDHADTNCSDNLQPFAVLSESDHLSQSQMSLAAPSLLDDYYTNILDCSCKGVVALALGSSVYLWNSETHSLVGRLTPKLLSGHASSHGQNILSLCWSSDGRGLCIGNRRGNIEMWDVEQGLIMRCLPSLQSAVRAVSWKQNLVSSGSDLGHIHHYDPRDSGGQVGTATQQGGVCSLQWSQDDQLASGSTEGLLHVWDSHITEQYHSRETVTTMRQPTSVKAMGWCPWQKNVIATGGGWKDGEVRVWDTKSGTCLSSVQTNSQVCCLRWTEEKRRLVTGHGAPHNHISSWVWDSPTLCPTKQLSGHSKRVLHLAINHNDSQILTAGADQIMHVWDITAEKK